MMHPPAMLSIRSMEKTITLKPEGDKALPSRGFLTVAFHASRPGRVPVRFDLGAARRVTFSRGATRRHEIQPDRTVHIELDDPTMSSPHAMLEKVDEGWMLVDQGSKNGTVVDGARIARALLPDGCVIAMGETFVVFRVAAVDVRPPVLDGEAVVGRPPALRTMHPGLEEELRRVRNAAAAGIPVLVLGETGTGKELIARAIHDLSQRDGSFVAVNCGAIPESIMASELFGVRRGAFSGAAADRPGLIRAADRGTLLLDEIGEMAPASQVALLRVLQERYVTPVGDTTPVPVDVRIVAATHRDLAQMAADGRFRDDLLARLAGLVITLPSLRQRREDLGLIVAESLQESGASRDLPFTPDAAHVMFSRTWRRNIRELRQALAAAVASGATRIERAHLESVLDDVPSSDRAASSPAAAPAGAPSSRSVDAAALTALLDQHDGNLSAVARVLSTSRTQVARLMERFGITRQRR
jgi:transcriptional regulator of acetoin/glycerol metabolism